METVVSETATAAEGETAKNNNDDDNSSSGQHPLLAAPQPPPAYEDLLTPPADSSSPNRLFVEEARQQWLNEGGQVHENTTCEDDGDEPSFLKASIRRFLAPLHPVLLIFLLMVVLPFGYVSFGKFQRETDSTVHPIPGSLSKQAQEAFARLYHHDDWSDPMNPAMFVVLQAANMTDRRNHSLIEPTSAARTAAKQFVQNFTEHLETFCWHAVSPIHSNSTNSSDSNSTNGNGTADSSSCSSPWLRVMSYYSLEDAQVKMLASGALASRDGSVSIVLVQYTSRGTTKEAVSELMDVMTDYASQDNIVRTTARYFSIQFTGLRFFQRDLKASTRQDLRRMDWIVLPVALLLMGVVLRQRQDATKVASPRASGNSSSSGASANPVWFWIIPLVTMLTTVAVWSIIMAQLLDWCGGSIQITQFTPSIMMSLSLGMGIDYTLILLSRYLQEYQQQRSRAIALMLHHAGQVILLSGGTLMCTFLGLCWMPLHMLQSIGFGAAVCIGSAILVNLTVVPCLLLTPLGVWVVCVDEVPAQEARRIARHRRNVSWWSSEAGDDDNGEENNGLLLQQPLATEDDQPVEEHPSQRATDDDNVAQHRPVFWFRASAPSSIWHELSKHLLHPYRGIIILLVILQVVIIVGAYAFQLKSSISFDLVLPQASPSLETYHSLSAKFGPGHLSSYRILFDGSPTNMSMTSVEGFDLMHSVLERLSDVDTEMSMRVASPLLEVLHNATRTANWTLSGAATLGMPQVARRQLSVDDALSSRIKNEEFLALHQIAVEKVSRPRPRPVTTYNGIAVLHNYKIGHSLFATAKMCAELPYYCPFELARVLNVIEKQTTTKDGMATYVTATLPVNPFSKEGIIWLESVRKTIRKLGGSKGLVKNKVAVYLQGTPAVEQDAVTAVYAAFPTMIGITTAIVFVLLGLFFRSVFLPLRSLLSIGLTLVVAYGLATLVYQNGIFAWTGITSLSPMSADESAFCWLVPIMSFSILVGLALDYDIFLLSRVLEYRQEGYEHKSAIAAGLHSTGSIITAAGFIMALSFGSLMFGSNPVLYQWSFVLTTAVMLDTLVVRTLLVPILTNLSGPKLCWWPLSLPPGRIILSEFQESWDDVTGLLQSLEASSEYVPLASARGRRPSHG